MRSFRAPFVILFLSATLLACSEDENDPSGAPEPVACFDEVPKVSVGTAIEFNSECSENASTYLWDFGGKGTSTAPNPVFIFSAPGNYKVTLTVSNDTKSSTAERTVTVEALPDNCTFTHAHRDLKESETWKTGETHCITGYLQIRDGAILTIEPGVTINLRNAAAIYVTGAGAGIVAEGTEAEPILFTSREPEPQPGDWVSVGFINEDSAPSTFKHCIFEYGGNDIYASFDRPVGMVNIENAKNVSIDHCTFRKSLAYAVHLDTNGELASFTNNTISEAGDYAIYAYTQNVHTIGTGNVINSKGIWVQNGSLNKDATWLKQTCPYYTKTIHVGSDEGMTLTIAPGVEMRFIEDNLMYIGQYGEIGMLIAQGTPTEKIKFTSASDTPSPGDWGGLSFGTGTMGGSILDHVIIEYASGDDTNYGSVSVTTNSLVIQNTEIIKNQGIGIRLDHESSRAFAGFSNNIVESPPTAYGIKMGTVALSSFGEGNVVKGKCIYAIDNGLRDVQHIIVRNLGIPYVIDGDMRLGSKTYPDHTFTIEPGTVLRFTKNSQMTIGNQNPVAFIASGTAEKPIVFTSAYDTPAPGDWEGLEFYSHVTESILDHCILEYGGGRFGNVASWIEVPGKQTVSNSQINYSALYGIYDEHNTITKTNNTFTGNVDEDVKVIFP